MVINYVRGSVHLMIDIDKIDFISSEQVSGKTPLMYDVSIGFCTGRSIDLRLDYNENYDLMKILGEFMKTRKDYMTAVNPFLDKDIKDMCLSVVAQRACNELGIKTLGDLAKHNRQDFLALNQVGKKTVTELDELLDQHLLHFGYKA